MGANTGISTRAGDLIADILEPLVKMDTERLEDLSTQEVIAQLEEANTEVWKEEPGSVVVASMDAEALYPSLDQAH